MRKLLFCQRTLPLYYMPYVYIRNEIRPLLHLTSDESASVSMLRRL